MTLSKDNLDFTTGWWKEQNSLFLFYDYILAGLLHYFLQLQLCSTSKVFQIIFIKSVSLHISSNTV